MMAGPVTGRPRWPGPGRLYGAPRTIRSPSFSLTTSMAIQRERECQHSEGSRDPTNRSGVCGRIHCSSRPRKMLHSRSRLNGHRGGQRKGWRTDRPRRAGKGDRVPAIWTPGNGPAIMIVHPEDLRRPEKHPTRRHSPCRPLAADHRRLPNRTRRRTARGSRPAALIFNKSDSANRVQDILTGLKFLSRDNQPAS